MRRVVAPPWRMKPRGRWRLHAWRPWWAPAVEVAMEDGAAAVDRKEKGATAAMEDGDEGRWRMEEPLPPWRREPSSSIRRREMPLLSRKEEVAPSRPRFRHPHVVAGELYSQRPTTSRPASLRRRR
jgi:hypothetical protein